MCLGNQVKGAQNSRHQKSTQRGGMIGTAILTQWFIGWAAGGRGCESRKFRRLGSRAGSGSKRSGSGFDGFGDTIIVGPQQLQLVLLIHEIRLLNDIALRVKFEEIRDACGFALLLQYGRILDHTSIEYPGERKCFIVYVPDSHTVRSSLSRHGWVAIKIDRCPMQV